MRIESKVVGAVVADSRETKPAVSPPTTQSSKQPVSTVVSLSHAAQANSTDYEDINPINRTRLDEIRNAINHDRYPIDLDKLASKIVEDDKLRGRS
ncbi:MAG TPA: flagellar biosynthesis anti-sigma factor FlgM [Kofleriaceae bacterium]|nr:flagellar biosynthesis anti-sigma factor FlgM [Kofleriaceae bacterium]